LSGFDSYSIWKKVGYKLLGVIIQDS